MRLHQICLPALLAAVLAIAAGGCGEAPSDTKATTTEPTPASGNGGQPDVKGEVIPVDFTNDQGKVVCPVMGTAMDDKSKAVGHQDYEGKRYYFCCGDCPSKFEANPAKYSDGKAMPSVM